MKAVYLANAPVTEQARGLGLTAEIQEQCRVVYEKDPAGEGYVFHSLWRPEREYNEKHMIMPVGSTYAGLTDELARGTCFANAEWSSNDPKYPHPDNPKWTVSWIGVIRSAYFAHAAECRRAGLPVEEYNADLCCAERDKIYPSDGSREFLFECTNNGEPGEGIYLQGAHVLMNATASAPVPKGGYVCLLPLCTAHNTYVLKEGSYSGQGYYMKLERPMRAVLLSGYMYPSVPGTLP